MANISYEHIRSELVHDISTAGMISFSETIYNGIPVPAITFELLYSSLRSVLNTIQSNATATNMW